MKNTILEQQQNPSTKKQKTEKTEKTENPQQQQINSLNILNPTYLTPNDQTIQEYKKNKPFPFLVLPDFIKEDVAIQVLEELKKEKWYQKRNDLYTFKQTDDLKNSNKPGLRDFRSVLYSDSFRRYVTGITGIELEPKVDIAGQWYDRGGTLLCHDDELDGRRVAFIWYLVPHDWSFDDGGHFSLFDNFSNHPGIDPVHIFVPKWNHFLFFETTPTTWHQVSEILAQKKPRISISGWFHGSPIPHPPPSIEPELPTILAVDFPIGENLEFWIDPQYLDIEAQEAIRCHFEKNSSIALNDFLILEKYHEVLTELDRADWKPIGPANRRHYSTLGRWKAESETGIIKQLNNFLRSQTMCKYLERLTGLSIISSGIGEVRCFRNQDYTLVHDNEFQHQLFGLDMYFNVQDPNSIWEDSYGGYVTYMDSETELLALPPQSNVLSLVYRDVGCMKFVKFLTSQAPCNHFDFQHTFTTDASQQQEGDDVENDDDPEYDVHEEDEGGDEE